ncbi:MAG: alpha/beta hydrolase [Chitinophagaceae bacterium]|nr:alpha/beta hydrolase [Chitinophagaceae bacterium]
MLNLISSLMAFTVTFNSCTKPIPINNTPVETLTNVSYGTDPRQKMDIYLPPDRGVDSTRLLIVIHGGGWNGGDKSDFGPYITELQKRLPGYAFANINYRLCNLNNGTNRFPAQENDVKAAIEFLTNKSAEYKISQAIALLGASAGGHLALLEGYKNAKPDKIKAIVSFFGPSDLTELYEHPGNPSIPLLLNAVTGTTPAQNKILYQQSSPVHFVSAQSPPTLLLQGGRDVLVPENQSVLLKNKLQSLGVPHQYVYYPTEGHGWGGNNLFDSLDKIAAFLREHFR